MFIDSHCHINFPELEKNLEHVLSNMQENKITNALCISVELDSFPSVLAVAENNRHIYASVGVHPDYENIQEPTISELVELSQNPNVVAIGETGLDYFRLDGDLTWQRDRFRTHIRAAVETSLPLVIHTRQAQKDTIAIMKDEGANNVGGVMHCFTESYEMAKQALDLGFYISFSGIVTFKNAEELRQTAKKIPLDRILIETDSPYLAPVPNRGKLNEPANVVYVAKKIAELHELPIEKVGEQTSKNFFELFKKCQCN
ncbi:MAG: TatD family hydrolase [Methylophilaceae bacterium]|nr:TatD family hydrolase [Methylophilaceae bacterium]MBL6726368.1 TatD family hydrolase [Methylophilaceae bacterium]MBL6791555.1 TatD family hydrolase [Methylophilaceae bacterium]